MPRYKVTVYRPRLERVTVTVTAENRFAAAIDEDTFRAAEALPPEKWELLPPEARFYAGDSSYQNDTFTNDSELIGLKGSNQ